MTNSEKNILDQANASLFQYDRWRTSFLNSILRMALGLGLILFLINIPIFRGAEFIIYSVIYAAFLIITFASLPYSVKAGALLIAGYFVATYTIIQYGPWTSAIVYYLGITLFASLLFDKQLDRWVFTINLMTIVAISGLHLVGQLTLGTAGFPVPSLADWVSFSVDYIVLAIALTWAINLLKNEFKTVADQFQGALTFVSKDRAELEKRVNERTAKYIAKTEQLRATSHIARQTADIQDLGLVFNMVVDLITEQFGYYHAGIFLMNESGDEVILQAASSQGGKKMLERGHSFRVGAKSIVGYSASEKKPRIALDVGTDAVFFENPDLPNTRSELALPLMIRDRVLGILDIQSEEAQAFSTDDIDVLQILTDQISIEIENVRLLEEAQTALVQFEALTTARTREAWSQKTREGNISYTYTPLGMRPGKASHESDQAVNIPITLRGQKIGSISLSRRNNTVWNDVDLHMVTEVAYQTGLAVDNVRLVEDATERANQEQTVGELATRFSQSTDIDSLLQTAARELGQVEDVAEVSVYIGQVSDQAPRKRRTKRTSE